jgi:hypothetical protein
VLGESGHKLQLLLDLEVPNKFGAYTIDLLLDDQSQEAFEQLWKSSRFGNGTGFSVPVSNLGIVRFTAKIDAINRDARKKNVNLVLGEDDPFPGLHDGSIMHRRSGDGDQDNPATPSKVGARRSAPSLPPWHRKLRERFTSSKRKLKHSIMSSPIGWTASTISRRQPRFQIRLWTAPSLDSTQAGDRPNTSSQSAAGETQAGDSRPASTAGKNLKRPNPPVDTPGKRQADVELISPRSFTRLKKAATFDD